MAAGWTAMRFGWASYIVPFLFVYSPALIMRGSAVEIGLVMILSIAGIWFGCAAFTGYAMRVMGLPMRIAFGVAAHPPPISVPGRTRPLHAEPPRVLPPLCSPIPH